MEAMEKVLGSPASVPNRVHAIEQKPMPKERKKVKPTKKSRASSSSFPPELIEACSANQELARNVSTLCNFVIDRFKQQQ